MSTPRVFLIGLPAHHHLIPPEIQPKIASGLKFVEGQFAEAGIQYEFYGMSPDEGVAELGPKLQSFRPVVVIIGNGIRSNMALTPFMEQIIDTVRTCAPQAKLGFNTKPDDSLDAVKRAFPTAFEAAANTA